MKKYPVIYLIIGIIILIVPTVVYLCFLVPKLSYEYNTLMASGGIIGGVGFFGASKIPENIKFGSIYKLAVNSFSTFIVAVIIQKFFWEISGLIVTFIVSFIIYKICLEVYKNARRRKETREISEEIARNIIENSK